MNPKELCILRWYPFLVGFSWILDFCSWSKQTVPQRQRTCTEAHVPHGAARATPWRREKRPVVMRKRLRNWSKLLFLKWFYVQIIYIWSGWWFQLLWKIFVSWGYYSQIYGKILNVPNHQPDKYHTLLVL